MLRTLRTRDKLLTIALTAYLGFGLACIIEDDGNNNSTNNNGGGGGGGGSVTEVNDDVSAEVTWRGTINVNTNVLVRDGGKLTIEEGTVINMCADCVLDVGWNNNAATLKINGTADKPVIIRGDSATNGFWKYVSIGENTTSDSFMRHVVIQHAGQQDASALYLRADIVVDNVEISGSNGDGVTADDFKSGSKDLKVSGVQGYPVRLNSASALDNYPQEGTPDLLQGDKGYISLDFGEIEENITIRKLGLPYFMPEGMLIREEGTLVQVDPGVRIDVNAGENIDVGWNNNASGVQFNGTSDAPIVIQGLTDDVGVWEGVYFRKNVLSTTSVAHLTVRNAGSDGGAVDFDAPVKVEHLTVEKSEEYGVVISEAGLDEDSTMIVIKDGEGVPARVNSDALRTLPVDGTFAQGNASKDYIEVDGGDVYEDGVVAKADVPYRITESLLVREGASWTISPGVTMIFGAGTVLDVGWNNNEATLIAQGSAAEPITFDSADASKGYWGGVYVGKNTTSQTVFDYVNFSYGGEQGEANLRLNRPTSVTNSSFSNSRGYGIHVNYGSNVAQDPAIDYTSSNTFDGNTQGDVLDDRED